MKNIKRIAILSIGFFLATPAVASAQSLLPQFFEDIQNNFQTDNITGSVTNLVRFALTMLFGIVVLVAIVYSILAAIKYIRSQGEAGEIEEANKAIKAIFQGLVAMFVGIIGIIIIFAIFDTGVPEPTLPAVCSFAPESPACRVCTEFPDTDGDGEAVGDGLTCVCGSSNTKGVCN